MLAIPVLLGILFLTFTLTRLLPGDPCLAALQEKATEVVCREFNRSHGLDRPILGLEFHPQEEIVPLIYTVLHPQEIPNFIKDPKAFLPTNINIVSYKPGQFEIYMKEVSKGDFGDSIQYKYSTSRLIVERLPTTIELTVFAMFFAAIIGIPLGVISAYYHNSVIDLGTMILANIGVSMPIFWLGLMLGYVFSVTLKGTFLQFPPGGSYAASGVRIEPFYQVWGMDIQPGPTSIWSFIANMDITNELLSGHWNEFRQATRYMVLPMIALGTIPMSIIARMTRSSLLEVLGQNYVRTARAKGVREPSVVMKHALRNALIPVVTIMGLSLGSLLGGAVLTETVFGLGGVGDALRDSIEGRDYTVVQAFTVVIAFVFVVINLLTDVLYVFLDPRIKLQ